MKLALRLTPTLVAFISAVILLCYSAYEMARERANTITRAELQTQNFARVLEEHARQTLHRVGTRLAHADAVLSPLHRAGRFDVTPTKQLLTQLLPADHLIQNVLLLDSRGKLVLATQTEPDLSDRSGMDRDYFAPHVHGAAQELILGAPLKTADGQWLLPVSRRVGSAQAAFEGVWVAMVRAAYFQSFYDSIERGPDGLATLFLSSGHTVVTSPPSDAVMSQNWSDSPLFRQHLPAMPTATVQQVVASDGIERIYSYRALTDYPVVVTYGLSMPTILASWQQSAGSHGLLLVAALLLLAGATIALERQDALRKKAMTGLKNSELHLRAIIAAEPECILIVDAQGKLLEINPAGLAMIEADSLEQVCDKPLLDLVAPEYRATCSQSHQKVLAGETVELTYEVVGFKGRRRWLESHAVPLQHLGQPVLLAVTRDITERKQAENALLMREKHARSLLRLSQKLELSQTYAEILKAARDEVKTTLLYQTLWIFLLTEDKKYFKALVVDGPMSEPILSENGISLLTIEGDKMLEEIAEAKKIVLVEDARTDLRTNKEIVAMIGNRTVVNVPIILFDKHLGCVGTGTFGDEGVRVPGAAEQEFLSAMASHLAVALDRIHLITERQQAQEELRIAATAFESQQGMFITNAQRIILRVNKAFTDITGYSAEDAVGQTPQMLSSGRHDRTYFADMAKAIATMGSWQGEIWNRRKNGEIYPGWLTASAVKDKIGQITHHVAIFSDISERVSAQAQIDTLAFYDPLTLLPNRRLLLNRLEQSLHVSTRHDRKNALLFVDLDNFKTLNDTLGHSQGDALLVHVAQRLKACIREGDTVAHLGSDEFVVLLEDLSEDVIEAATQAESVGDKILRAFESEFLLDSGPYHGTSSIGVTLFGGKELENSEQPLQRAELAMFEAKVAGHNTLRFFDARMQAQVSFRATMEANLRKAVPMKQLLLHYQPQVLDSGQITGVEALVRWQHPQHGMVSPAQFIPLAEETGLILPIGQWVLETACSQLAAWAAKPGLAHLTVAVNVSAHQFQQNDFVNSVASALESTGANPKRLKLELTESMLAHDVEAIIAKMDALKVKGVTFSLDDFGTGYSSLSYLKRLPLDQLKIDQGFVRNIVTDANDAAIAKMVIALAGSLGLSVIAEGVELQAQADFLAHLGCHAYQGYWFGRPLSLEGLEAFMNSLCLPAS